MKTVEIYTKDWCSYCASATTLLESLSIPFTEIDVTSDPVREQEMRDRAHQRTVPQIFFGDQHIGGSDDLRAVVDSGELERLVFASYPIQKVA